VNHVANLLSSEDGKNILNGYVLLKGKVARNQDLVKDLKEALKWLNIKWCDWDDFVLQGVNWDWKINEKDNGKQYFNFIDTTSNHKYKGVKENIHKSVIAHSKVKYDYENYVRFNTRNLITCLDTGVSNFYFRDCKAPLSDGLARFMIKSRAGVQFTPKRKSDILRQGDGLCACGKSGTLKHILSCCPFRAPLMTKRQNNVAKIVVQAIEANNRKNIVKSTTGQFIHWNQEIRLPDGIADPRHPPESLKEEVMRRKPDVWFYTIKKNGQECELNLNLVEVTIPWGDVNINEEKFDKNENGDYKLRPFKIGDVSMNSLTEARNRKENKYVDIVKEASSWLNRNKEEIGIKYKATRITVECHYIIISNLGMVPKTTETDLCRLLKGEEKDKPRYARMWLKRMVNQVLRGSFECYINAGKEITDIEHVCEVNHNIANPEIRLT
jgi:hypothetical protein